MLRGVLVAVLLVVASVTGVGIVSANESPLAAAGLDQEVVEGSTVYLDGGGSLDPDGRIEEYRWTITTPNGTTIRPDCPTCARTQFQTKQNGTYNATLTVVDDDGATASDTLYVTANSAEPPTVRISGPSAVEDGTSATFEADVSAGTNELATLVWMVNGTERTREDVDGYDAKSTLSLDFETQGQRELQVRAIDTTGTSETATHGVEVTQSSDGTSSNGDMDAYASMLRRTDESYEILMPRGVVDGRGPGTMLDENEVRDLQRVSGVTRTSVYTNTGPVDALSITNPNLKEDIDKEAGKRGAGFLDSSNEYINPRSASYEVNTKRQFESPGVNWERTDRVVTGTTTTENRVNKENYELIEVIEKSDPQTYKSPLPHSPLDQQVGTGKKYTTSWQDTPPADGDYVATRKVLTHYTWTETRTKTKRVKVGTEVVRRSPAYGWKTVRRVGTEQVCVEYMSIFGPRTCVKTELRQTRTMERVWGVIGTEKITRPVYETRTYTETVTESGKNPPRTATDVTPHYNTQYKVREFTGSVPLWQSASKKYRYEIFTYEWERSDI